MSTTKHESTSKPESSTRTPWTRVYNKDTMNMILITTVYGKPLTSFNPSSSSKLHVETPQHTKRQGNYKKTTHTYTLTYLFNKAFDWRRAVDLVLVCRSCRSVDCGFYHSRDRPLSLLSLAASPQNQSQNNLLNQPIPTVPLATSLDASPSRCYNSWICLYCLGIKLFEFPSRTPKDAVLSPLQNGLNWSDGAGSWCGIL